MGGKVEAVLVRTEGLGVQGRGGYRPTPKLTGWVLARRGNHLSVRAVALWTPQCC